MKRITLTICAAALLLAACNNAAKNESTTDSTGKTISDESATSEKEWKSIDTATMMKAMTEYATPGAPQQQLAKSVGNWTAEVISWWSEGGKADTSIAKVTNKMHHNLHLVSNYSGNMMGMPFEGESVTAYDNATKQFTSTWIDNWSSGIMTMTGNWDEGTKTLTQTGKYPDIFRPGRECTMRQELKVIDDKTHHFIMYGPDQKTGKEFKMMEIMMKKK